MDLIQIDALKKLHFKKQIIFVYLTCERLYRNYTYFSEHFGFGNPIRLRQAIDILRENLLSQNFNRKQIESLITSIDEITPLPEDYDTILASSAMDACGVVHESLYFLLDAVPSRLSDISTFATDTVDMFIQEEENLDFNTDKLFFEKIQNHPLMQREVSIQNGIISFLNKSKDIDDEDIETLINLQKNSNRSNLDL